MKNEVPIRERWYQEPWVVPMGLYLIVVLAITGPWFIQRGYLFFTDFVWGPHIVLDWTNSNFLLNLIIVLLAKLLALPFVQKCFVTAVLMLIAIGSWQIAKLVLRTQPVLAWLVGLFGLFNPFVYDRLMYGQFGVLAAFGCFLLGIALLVRGLRDEVSERLLFGAAISIAFMLQFAMHFIFFIGIVCIGMLTYIIHQRNVMPWRKLILTGFMGMAIIVLLNINWLVGSLTHTQSLYTWATANITKEDFDLFATRGDSPTTVLTNVVLMSGFWGKEQFRYADLANISENWGRSFLLLAPLMLWGVFVLVRNKHTRFCAVGLLAAAGIAIVLAGGIRLPKTGVFTWWLFDHFPLYRGLRDTQKWVALLIVCYMIFLSYGIREFFARRIVVMYRWLFIILLSAVTLLQAPLLLGGAGGQIRAAEYPADWAAVDQFLLEAHCDGKVMVLPWHQYLHLYFTSGVVSNPAPVYFRCPVVSGTNVEIGTIYDNSGNVESRRIADWIARAGETDLLSQSDANIGYILLMKETNWLDYYWWVSARPELVLIKETEHLLLYRITTYGKT